MLWRRVPDSFQQKSERDAATVFPVFSVAAFSALVARHPSWRANQQIAVANMWVVAGPEVRWP